MKPRVDIPPVLRDLAVAQAGVITLGQAAQAGLGRHSVTRLVAQERWNRIAPSLLYLHWRPPTWLALAWAGVLYAEPESRVGGEAAAFLHGLADEPPEQIVIMIPHSRRLTSRMPWTFRRERPGTRSQRSPGDPARLTVEDTVLDLCLDERSAVHWLTASVQRRLTTLARLGIAYEERARLPRRAVLRELLAYREPGLSRHSSTAVSVMSSGRMDCRAEFAVAPCAMATVIVP